MLNEGKHNQLLEHESKDSNRAWQPAETGKDHQ